MGRMVIGPTGRGQKVVAVAGTPVPLSATTLLVQNVTISAPTLNSGNIYVGDSLVSNVNGAIIPPGQSMGLGADSLESDNVAASLDLSQIYIDADFAGDKVLLLTFDIISEEA